MVEDIPNIPIDFPVKAEASASGSYSVDHKKITFDSKVYPPCTNKIEDLGRIKKRKFSIVCDGQGHMNMKEMLSPDEKIEKLGRLRDEGLITNEEFETKKKEILEKEF